MNKQMFCNNCKGIVKVIQRGNILYELLLWIIFFPVGIGYSIWRMSGQKWVCKHCKKIDLLVLTSPAAEQAILHQRMVKERLFKQTKKDEVNQSEGGSMLDDNGTS